MQSATAPATKPQFTPENLREVARLITQYPPERKKSALLPVLHLAQAQFGGWVSPAVQDMVAEALDLQPIEVYEVATFYTMFNLKPVGKHVLEVCRTGPCLLRGAEELMHELEQKTGAKFGGPPSADGMFSLKEVECLASCGTAPMLQCREDYHEWLDKPGAVDAMLAKMRAS
jgi:NADH-quinone oxidoreductase subunit E